MKVDLIWADKTIEFANCFSLNPLNFAKTELNAIFMVNSAGEIYPHPITEGPYRNVSAMPEGEPIDHAAKIIKILSKYHDNPEQVYSEMCMDAVHGVGRW